jgi:hypothetical protein
MPSLLSGSLKNTSSPTGFALPTKVQYQLGPTPTTSTGYTLISNSASQVTYASSLGNIQFSSGTMYSNLPYQNINIIGTGTSTVIVSGGTPNFSTNTGALQVIGGIGISDGLYAGADIHVNNLTIGQGYQGQNNIIIEGTASPQLNEGRNGQNSVAIGYTTLKQINNSIGSIAIGRYALSTGSYSAYNIAIGDSALKELGTWQLIPGPAITNATNGNPIVVTSPLHGLTTGTHIVISDTIGMYDLNYNESIDNSYYVQVLDINTIALYTDPALITPVDGTYFDIYSSGGVIDILVDHDNNIAIGVNAGVNFLNGAQNFFLGNNIATSFTTGSYNFFVGHEVANNMTQGNANISIGGDNLVDGMDNQINIGSVFYFDGTGYLQLNADTGLGLGTSSTGTDNGALAVYGGVGISDNLYVGTSLNVTTTSTFGGDVIIDGGLTVDVGNHDVTLSPVGGSVVINPTLGGNVTIEPSNLVTIQPGATGNIDNIIVGANTSTRQNAYFVDAYANNFYGLASTATNLDGGARGSIPYQASTGTTFMLPIGFADTVLTSDGTTATWKTISQLSATATHAESIFIYPVSTATYYLALSTQTNTYSTLDDDATFTYVTTPVTTSSYFITGTSVLNVPGSIYSIDGGENENSLLYTPRVVVGPTPPDIPRVGDFWIDSSANAQYQYIQDGTNRIWLQIAII